MFNVSLVQFTSSTDWRWNLKQAVELMAQSLAFQPSLIVLPENIFLFDAKQMRTLAEGEGTEIILSEIMSFARQHQVYILIGSHPMAKRPDGSDVKDGRVRQSCLLISHEGKLVARYDKVHLFDVLVNDKAAVYQESRFIEPGDVSTVVYDMAGVKLGLSICYDLRFPELYRCLLEQDADLVVVPSAFTHKTGSAHWHTLLQARAIENQYFMLGVNQAGWHNETRRTFGNTVAYSPWGDMLGCLDDQEVSVLNVALDLDEIEMVRRAMPCKGHRRIR
ncbi:2-oxoglutaramate amidase [Marinomonas gallaica]|uniref:2-oxoglutaramate amidase n=1 Tax=Marinomonas gallaica TaxID=1806667 RepID=A0A1C3JU42_9GAMM|nr:carbon-nitrogen hydrolase family protein [Marinomonas gallaica]SBT18606.1 2-oxoglutaramate amidase [Marinomonas gallaica]SBT21561.1 2-oxoglutaramate amidase [Marinomonas gallaica]